jgi:hypothetical protein
MLGSPQLDGFYFYRSFEKSQVVLDTLMSLPSSLQPSRLTLTAAGALLGPCSPGSVGEKVSYNSSDIAGALQNWYHALCAPADDPSWEASGYDPAYQGQQMALTLGLMCINSCDINNRQLPGTSMVALGSSHTAASSARDDVCEKYQWESGNTYFSGLSSIADLALATEPLLGVPCSCNEPQSD